MQTDLFEDLSPFAAEENAVVNLKKLSMNVNFACRYFIGFTMTCLYNLMKNGHLYSPADDTLFKCYQLKVGNVSRSGILLIFFSLSKNGATALKLTLLIHLGAVLVYLNEKERALLVEVLLQQNVASKMSLRSLCSCPFWLSKPFLVKKKKGVG